jgi:hypothetical protein
VLKLMAPRLVILPGDEKIPVREFGAPDGAAHRRAEP